MEHFSATTIERISDKKNESSLVDERLQLLTTYDRLASQLVFTDIRKAQKYLDEMNLLLKELNLPDFELNYYLNSALVENQLYNYKLSSILFKQAIAILQERGDISQLAEAFIDYAGTLINLESTDEALGYLLESEKYLKNFPDNRLQARLTCRKAYLHLKNSNRGKALQLFLDAEQQMASLGKSLDSKDYYFVTLIWSGLGAIYAQSHEPFKSIQAYQKALEICESKGMRSRLSWHYLYVGNSYMAVGDDDNAMKYFRQAIKVMDDVNQQTRASAYANMGYCCMRKGHFNDALVLMAKAYPLFKEKKDKNLANIEWWRAKVFEAMGKRKKSLKFYFTALDFARAAEDNRQISGILKDIATWYADESYYKEAYDYQKIYEQAVQEYLMEVKATELRELELKYEAERKQQETEMFRLQATGLQLKALRAQMNPHFVFNALNSVQNFITGNDPTLASKYLAQFAHLMRQSLEYSDLEIINVKLRFESKLSYEIDVDEEIEEDILGVPTMIIQPYIENAIEHGIRPKKNGLIRVIFSLEDDDTIRCVVEDNGVGRAKARQLQENNPAFKDHRSLGTKITQERLEILNKQKRQGEDVVRIMDLKDEETGEPKGTRVEIFIPIVEIQMK
jgi:two-component sensor histidine kinase